MSKFLLIAAADFAASCGPLTAGEPIAEIQTDLELGELASLIRTRNLIHVESDADPTVADTGPDTDLPEHGNQASPTVTPTITSAQSAITAGDDLLSKLADADLIDSKTVKLLAVENVHTAGDLFEWMSEGNRPRQINGIGDVSEAKLLAATGLTLP